MSYFKNYLSINMRKKVFSYPVFEINFLKISYIQEKFVIHLSVIVPHVESLLFYLLHQLRKILYFYLKYSKGK